MSKSSQILDTLYQLAQRKKIAIVSICAVSGAGKSTLAQALSGIFELGGSHIELDFWKKISNREREELVRQAEARGDSKTNTFWNNNINQTDWIKFRHDLPTFLRTGSLNLHNIYQQTTGELTGRAAPQVRLMPPHSLLVAGTTLFHPEIRHFADYAIYLNIPRETLERRRRERDGHRKTEKQIQADNERLYNWGTQYFGEYAKTADVELNETELDELHALIAERTGQNPASKERPEQHRTGIAPIVFGRT